MLVSDVYTDCFYYEESTLAHCIFHLLEEGKITLDDDISKINFSQVDQLRLAELVENNQLGVHKVGIYSLMMTRNEFVFIFAGSEYDAIQFYTTHFHRAPLNCHEYPLDYQLTRGNEVISFRDLRREMPRFPAIAGYFLKNQRNPKVES